MDITTKYRAKYPPKEHEEAVRMLFEEIAASNNNNSKHHQIRSNKSSSRDTSSNNYESEGRSLNSSIHASASDVTTSSASKDRFSGIMHSKGTSTSDESASSNPVDSSDSMFNKPIPSRTIAVQCDLKESSLRNDNLFDGSMQASSISSTRYGFYSFSPEVLESRRKLSRKTVSRESAPSNQHDNSQIEAPTSMSESSFSASASEDEANYKESIISKQIIEEQSTLPINLKSSRVSSSQLNNDSGRATRITSLPRRPVTAMSYVSTSRLRDQNSPSRFRNEHSQEPSKSLSRAMSQQAISRPRILTTKATLNQSSSNYSDSDSSLTQEMHVNLNRRDDVNRLGKTEEILVKSKKYPPAPSKPPRPTLVSSVHNEQLRDYRTLERTPKKSSDYTTYGRTESAATNYSSPSQHIGNDENKQRGFNSMSLSRNSRSQAKTQSNNYEEDWPSSGYCTTSRRPYRVSRVMESVNLGEESPTYTVHSPSGLERGSAEPEGGGTETYHSNSIRKITRPRYSYKQNVTQGDEASYDQAHDTSLKYPRENTLTRNKMNQQRESEDDTRNMNDNVEFRTTKTWNSNTTRSPSRMAKLQNGAGRKSSRSYSVRSIVKNNYDKDLDLDEQDEYYKNNYKTSDFSPCNSSSESHHTLEESRKRFSRIQKLNYDSQQRLNEIGLPEVNLVQDTRCNDSSQSYLDLPINRTNTLRRAQPQVTGRAMSQQSLTRPTMPLSSARRRGGSNSGSDVGGSSMSLMSRLHGRYENAHTRTPIVMYIPQVPASSRTNLSTDGISMKVGSLRKSIRTRQKASSQDRLRKRSLSRNGSDSESSSMLRTLMKPRTGRVQGNYSSKRMSRMNHPTLDRDNDSEETDGVAQLASDLDTYRFRRQYSVPKDAKINWFSKLKQRVSSGSR